jgi:hypothetical protein
MTDLEKVQKALDNAIDYLNGYEHLTVGKEVKAELGHAKTLVENLAIHGVVGRSKQLFCSMCQSTHVYQPEPESIKCYSCGFYGAK